MMFTSMKQMRERKIKTRFLDIYENDLSKSQMCFSQLVKLDKYLREDQDDVEVYVKLLYRGSDDGWRLEDFKRY